jgi:hypothetical protein
VAGLKRLPGAVQPQDWLHTAKIFRQSSAGKGRLWETYFVELAAPDNATQQLQQFAQKNSALRWDSVHASTTSGTETGRFGDYRDQLRRGVQGGRAMRTSGARKNANFEHKELPGDEDFPGY